MGEKSDFTTGAATATTGLIEFEGEVETDWGYKLEGGGATAPIPTTAAASW